MIGRNVVQPVNQQHCSFHRNRPVQPLQISIYTLHLTHKQDLEILEGTSSPTQSGLSTDWERWLQTARCWFSSWLQSAPAGVQVDTRWSQKDHMIHTKSRDKILRSPSWKPSTAWGSLVHGSINTMNLRQRAALAQSRALWKKSDLHEPSNARVENVTVISCNVF